MDSSFSKYLICFNGSDVVAILLHVKQILNDSLLPQRSSFPVTVDLVLVVRVIDRLVLSEPPGSSLLVLSAKCEDLLHA